MRHKLYLFLLRQKIKGKSIYLFSIFDRVQFGEVFPSCSLLNQDLLATVGQDDLNFVTGFIFGKVGPGLNMSCV